MIARDFRMVEKNTLKGFFTLELDSGLILHECALHEKDGKPWVGLPAKPQIDAEGHHRIGADGKKQYTPDIEFVSKKLRDAFSAQAVKAVQALRAKEK
jgi:hypothetical protein